MTGVPIAAVVAVGLAAAAAYVVVRPPASDVLWGRLADRLAGSGRSSAADRSVEAMLARWRRRLGSRTGRIGLAVLGVLATPPLTVRYGLVVPLVAVALAVAALLAPRLRARRSARRQAEETRRRVAEACEVAAAELRVGRTPSQTLEAAARVLPLLGPVAAASRLGGDVPAALRRARASGAESLGMWAVAWEAAEGSGAGLADVLDRVASGLRDEAGLRREIGAQLSAPRATARLLCFLPLLGVLLGAGVGADPVRILVGTPYGLACLVVGGGLAAGGVYWVERLAQNAEAV